MKTETLRSCVKYFEKIVLNEVKQAHKDHTYDTVELSDYAKHLIDKNYPSKKPKRKAFELTSYAKHLLNKNSNNSFS